MAYGGGSSGKLPSDDIGWKFGIPLENNRHKIMCKFCGKELNGGITRLKQHLAHRKGQVAPCANVSGAVRTLMTNHLNNYKGKKLDKRKMNKELTEQIRASQCDDDENDDEDLEMVMARQNRASDIEVAPSLGFARTKGNKQSKLSSRFLKEAKKKLGRAVSQFVLFTPVPTNIVNSKWLKPMLDTAREVGKGTKLPTSYEVTEVYLPMEYEALLNWIKSHKPSWAERGVTIMCDGWSGPTRKHIVNFLMCSNGGTIFQKPMDVTNVSSRTANYYLGLMDKVVDEIGEEYVV
ncbi:uncharacterized protein LOC114316620 [Camellia sinensis]|uniref:uncharacterized protein LOC114316620 n=1 Tax=Camellia sinensis TaxID=4442 RepID=UPI0010358906|nr:uncharacterized protein LOC114316620 [Camellia sinensis]